MSWSSTRAGSAGSSGTTRWRWGAPASPPRTFRPVYLADLNAGVEETSVASARAYVGNLVNYQGVPDGPGHPRRHDDRRQHASTKPHHQAAATAATTTTATGA